MVKILTRLPYAAELKRREELFAQFINDNLNVTNLCRTREEAIEQAQKFDCLVCGSDQIWNLGAPGDEYAPDTLFFLDFEKTQKRVAYAASFGNWITQADLRAEEFIPWLKDFDAISVREQSGLDYLKKKGIECDICIDPTLLLDKEDYRAVAREPSDAPKDYILLFSWATTPDVVSAAKEVGKHFGLEVINIVPPPRAMFSGIKRKLDVGPAEFLWLIDNASFVVTNSFHGTVFSTIFEKPYVSIYKTKPDTRMQSILDFLGLSDRLVTANDLDGVFLDAVVDHDYAGKREKLCALRTSSLDYLRQNLKDE